LLKDAALLERYQTTPSRRERTSRFWRIDLEKLDVPATDDGHVSLPHDLPRGVSVTTLDAARKDRAEIFARAFARTDVQKSKFGALAAARETAGAFVHVSADVDAADPIVITYGTQSAAFFPYTVVYVERGARVTIVERTEASGPAFVCGAVEIVTEANADVTYATFQTLPDTAQILMARDALPGPNARIAWAIADLGAELTVGSADVRIANEGVNVDIAALFFPRGEEHVDLVTTVSHDAGHSSSETVVKSAATGRGQARYLGNILIARDAQGSLANLHDDALLLSEEAHIDSVPALEISANDVKAYHGATVGAIDDEQVFYMETRGIDRPEAERMIALGFFEPAIARFPGEALRDEVRIALQAKVG
jgi:Fe-S cluster assembly protein SufD